MRKPEIKKIEPIVKCPKCGSTMIKRKSKFSNSFWYGCSTFPKCKISLKDYQVNIEKTIKPVQKTILNFKPREKLKIIKGIGVCGIKIKKIPKDCLSCDIPFNPDYQLDYETNQIAKLIKEINPSSIENDFDLEEELLESEDEAFAEEF